MVILAMVVIAVALLLEVNILNYVNGKNAYRMSKALLDRVMTVLDENDKDREELVQLLMDEYIVRAKSVSYIVDAKPQVEHDVEELQKIASLMSIDEIHLFDENGRIYSGTLPRYFGYSFDSGEQMQYFKIMLDNKELSMCQEVTPNTAEGKEMMYAITWNEDGTKMIQVGIEPTRLLAEMKQTQVSMVVADMPVYEGMEIFVADAKTKIIKGATDSSKEGKKLDEIGISSRDIDKEQSIAEHVRIDGKSCRCVMKQDDNYIVAVSIENIYYLQSSVLATLIVGIYLIVASGCMLYMLSKVLKEKFEKEALIYTSNTDELTKCLNRHAYEQDINKLDLDEEWIYISLDLNGLKSVNDSCGHAAGDELIIAAAECMKKAFGAYGQIYRLGGDEFVVCMTKQVQQFEEALRVFETSVQNWHGELADALSISYGHVYSTEQAWENIHEVSKLADQRMYACKACYYRQPGRDRRR